MFLLLINQLKPMTATQIQQLILDETGVKTSVKKLTGSMKHHTRFSAMFQSGAYPKFNFEWRKSFVKQFKTMGDNGNYSTDYAIDILNVNIEAGEPLKFKKESKPKSIEQMKVREWGSKNSQLRLDKATARNAVKMKKGNTARYW